MKKDIIDELSQKKKSYEKEILELKKKVNTLGQTKKILEAEGLDTNNILECINSIKEKEEKTKDEKKKLTNIIRTIKSSRTKINKRTELIKELKQNVKSLEENLEQLKSKEDENDKKIEELNERLNENIKKLKHEESVYKGAITARERAFERYENLKKGIKYDISEKKTKARSKKKEVFVSKNEEKEETKPEIKEVKQEVKQEVEEKEETKPEIKEVKQEVEEKEETKPEVKEVKQEVEEKEETKPELKKVKQETEKREVINKKERKKSGKIFDANKHTTKIFNRVESPISYITINESTGKIEIDGNIQDIDRYVYLDVEKDVTDICKVVANKSSVFEQKSLISKVDFAIINGIKNAIVQDNSENMTEYERKRYLEKISGYIRTIKSSDRYKLPFILEYDCTGKMKKGDYIKVKKYIDVASSIGASVQGKRNLIFYREEVKPKSIGELSVLNYTDDKFNVQRIIEGDKSFVPKVNVEFNGSNLNNNISEKQVKETPFEIQL